MTRGIMPNTDLHKKTPNSQNSATDIHVAASSIQTCSAQTEPSTSRVHLSVIKESLRMSGMVLLVTGVTSCALCFYIFSIRGRTYYLDVATMSAFVTIIMGFLGLRTGQWKWFPNHICVSGFLFLCSLSFIQCCILGFMATDYHPHKRMQQVDVAAGAVCALSFLILFIATLGVCASACCRDPPQDNRFAIVL